MIKRMTTTGLFVAFFFFTATTITAAQNNHAATLFKEQINKMVQKVEKADTPKKKREILNTSFDKLLTAFEKVKDMKTLSKADQAALHKLALNITQKRNELNGLAGFKRVENSQLNNFAHFVQQDLEQADSTVTISVTVLLLIIIILLLL